MSCGAALSAAVPFKASVLPPARASPGADRMSKIVPLAIPGLMRHGVYREYCRLRLVHAAWRVPHTFQILCLAFPPLTTEPVSDQHRARRKIAALHDSKLCVEIRAGLWHVSIPRDVAALAKGADALPFDAGLLQSGCRPGTGIQRNSNPHRCSIACTSPFLDQQVRSR
jgi:hypothetical protein